MLCEGSEKALLNHLTLSTAAMILSIFFLSNLTGVKKIRQRNVFHKHNF